MRILTCEPTAEIHAAAIQAFLENMQSEQTRPIMEKYGLHNYTPEDWLPTHTMLGALNELAQHPGLILNMVAIGMEVGSIFPMPPGLEDPTVDEVLMAWDDIYQAINRNGDAGSILCERVGHNHYITIHTDLFPDDFSYGIVYGYGRRFLPRDTFFTVQYDDEILPRDRGGDGPTIIHLEWE